MLSLQSLGVRCACLFIGHCGVNCGRVLGRRKAQCLQGEDGGAAAGCFIDIDEVHGNLEGVGEDLAPEGVVLEGAAAGDDFGAWWQEGAETIVDEAEAQGDGFEGGADEVGGGGCGRDAADG